MASYLGRKSEACSWLLTCPSQCCSIYGQLLYWNEYIYLPVSPNRNLCDITKSGKLNAEQFALAMFLLAEKVRGKDPPKELPPNFIPPSLRHAGAVSAQNSTPSLQAPQLSQPFGSVTSSLGPTSKAVPPVLPTSASFGPADYTAIKELDTVTMEIETIKRYATCCWTWTSSLHSLTSFD